MPKKCAVLGCPSTTGHRFPTNPKLRQKWIDAIGPLDSNIPHERYLVCYRHFLPRDYSDDVGLKCRKRLRFTSCPSMYLNRSEVVDQKPVPNQLVPVVNNVNTYGLFIKKADGGAEEIRIKTEPEEQDSEPVENFADALPVEEIIIKPEPEDNFCQSEDPLSLPVSESIMPVHKKDEENHCREIAPIVPPKLIFFNNLALNKDVHITNPKMSPIVIAPKNSYMNKPISKKLIPKVPPKIVKLLPKSTPPEPGLKLRTSGGSFIVKKTFTLPATKSQMIRPKNNLDDYHENDMQDPHHAVMFYKYAKSQYNSVTENLTATIRMLQEEIVALKKKVAHCEEFHKDLEPHEEESSNEPVASCGINGGSSKRKAGDKDENEPPLQASPKPKKPVKLTSKPNARQKLKLSMPQANEESEETSDPKKAPIFTGPYRIVELEYFINAICNMHYHHSATCPNSKMMIDSETLTGTSGEWNFKCAKCGHERVILTDPLSCTQIWTAWLSWLVSQKAHDLHQLECNFWAMGVPFFYNFTPTTLKVLQSKRQISDIAIPAPKATTAARKTKGSRSRPSQSVK